MQPYVRSRPASIVCWSSVTFTVTFVPLTSSVVVTLAVSAAAASASPTASRRRRERRATSFGASAKRRRRRPSEVVASMMSLKTSSAMPTIILIFSASVLINSWSNGAQSTSALLRKSVRSVIMSSRKFEPPSPRGSMSSWYVRKFEPPSLRDTAICLRRRRARAAIFVTRVEPAPSSSHFSLRRRPSALAASTSSILSTIAFATCDVIASRMTFSRASSCPRSASC